MKISNRVKKILLIEDDQFIIDLYTTKLNSVGFSTDVATTGDEALAKLKEKPDLILLDVVLPRVDGWEILREIKENPELNSIPVIILSNLGQKSEVEKGLKLGAKKYLIKAHYTPSQVVKEIKDCLK